MNYPTYRRERVHVGAFGRTRAFERHVSYETNERCCSVGS